MSWSASNTRLTYRSIQYNRSIAAAEAATEKVVGQINRDFLYGGESLVLNNLNTYRQNTVPLSSDSPYWGTWEFNDANGNLGQTYVQHATAANYVVLNSTYGRLEGVCFDLYDCVARTGYCQSTVRYRRGAAAIATGQHPDFPVCHVFLG